MRGLCLLPLLSLVWGNEYQTHTKVPVLVNTIGPFNNPAESYKFYTLPFCAPKEETNHDHNLGESLAGDRRMHSLYDLRFKMDVQWQALCMMKLTAADVDRFIEAIKQHYFFEMFVDELPVKGFVGEIETISSYLDVEVLAHPGPHHGHNETHIYLFAHLDFSLSYNGAHVIACNLTTDPEQRIELIPGKEIEVEFSFGVHWHHTNVAFESRMEHHSKSLIQDQPIEIHWLSIINSCVLAVLLTALLGIIFTRILKKDFARYLELDEEDFNDEQDTGWKLVHGDVFRFPKYPMLLSSAVGTGFQLLVLGTCIIVLALVGTFYPGNRGAVYSAAVAIFSLTSGIAGYISTTMYVQMGGEKWATNAVLTACFYSVPFFLTFCVVNTMAIAYGSSSALPFGTILIVLLWWVLAQFPLTIIGAMRGRNPEPYVAPCKTNRAWREIPPTPWYRSSFLVLPLSGFLPFSAIYIELHYIFVSIWGHRVYTLFEILTIAFVLLLLVTAAISVALTYFQLTAEDYHWWWRSYLSGMSTGVFIYVYAVFYFFKRSEMSGLLQGTFFFGYVLMIAYAFALMLGAVSFMVSHRFVRYIYGRIKVD